MSHNPGLANMENAMRSRLFRWKNSSLPYRLSFAMSVVLICQPAHAQAGYLKGKVEQKNVFAPKPAASSAYDGDPFSNDNPDHSSDLPPQNTNRSYQQRPAEDRFTGTLPDEQEPALKSGIAGGDPDQSKSMQIAWDQWHQRVGQALFTRFNFMAKAAFKYSPPLACHISYTVTKDAQIKNIQMEEPSANVMFNVLVITALKSINGDKSLLQFPAGSRRTVVEKTGTFTQNYGIEGFRYTTGDKEEANP